MPVIYWDVSLAAEDGNLHTRCAACAALEGIPDPQRWAYERRWEYAAQPGWGEAYSSALAAGNPAPGKDPAVITDGMILSATQALSVA